MKKKKLKHFLKCALDGRTPRKFHTVKHWTNWRDQRRLTKKKQERNKDSLTLPLTFHLFEVVP